MVVWSSLTSFVPTFIAISSSSSRILVPVCLFCKSAHFRMWFLWLEKRIYNLRVMRRHGKHEFIANALNQLYACISLSLSYVGGVCYCLVIITHISSRVQGILHAHDSYNNILRICKVKLRTFAARQNMLINCEVSNNQMGVDANDMELCGYTVSCCGVCLTICASIFFFAPPVLYCSLSLVREYSALGHFLRIPVRAHNKYASRVRANKTRAQTAPNHRRANPTVKCKQKC